MVPGAAARVTKIDGTTNRPSTKITTLGHKFKVKADGSARQAGTKRRPKAVHASPSEGDTPQKKPNKKQLLTMAIPEVDLVALASRGSQDGSEMPSDCPEAHRKYYLLTTCIAILKGERLSKKFNGVLALVT